MRNDLSQDFLSECLTYCRETGEMYWRDRPASHFTIRVNRTDEHIAANWNSLHAGKMAGRLNKTTGYVDVCINGVRYHAHRLAWVIVYGKWPSEHIDHKNGNKSDNSILNLRQANRSQNLSNRGKNKNNTSGFKGVSFASHAGRWRAEIRCNGRKYRLGYFDTPDDAAIAYKQAALVLHGEFARFEAAE